MMNRTLSILGISCSVFALAACAATPTPSATPQSDARQSATQTISPIALSSEDSKITQTEKDALSVLAKLPYPEDALQAVRAYCDVVNPKNIVEPIPVDGYAADEGVFGSSGALSALNKGYKYIEFTSGIRDNFFLISKTKYRASLTSSDDPQCIANKNYVDTLDSGFTKSRLESYIAQSCFRFDRITDFTSRYQIQRIPYKVNEAANIRVSTRGTKLIDSLTNTVIASQQFVKFDETLSEPNGGVSFECGTPNSFDDTFLTPKQ